MLFLPVMVGKCSYYDIAVNRNQQPVIYYHTFYRNTYNKEAIMKTERIGVHLVTLYDNIEEMPIGRFHKYQKYSIIDSGLGGDLTNLDAHLQRAMAYIRKGEEDKAVTELHNLRQNVFFIQQGVNPQLLSCACLIAEMDGIPQNDLSEEGLQRLIDKLTDVPTNVFTALFEAVKKKISTELETYFPSLMGASSQEKEYSDLLKARTIEILNGIVSGKPDKQRIESLTDDLLTKHSPISFQGEHNFEVDYDKQFERMCIVLAQNASIDPKKCSVMEFYHAYEIVKEQSHKITKTYKNGRHK